MPKTLAEIELLNDPTLSSAEAEWWQRVWAGAVPAEPEPVVEPVVAPQPARSVEACVYAGRLAGLPLPDGDTGAEDVL